MSLKTLKMIAVSQENYLALKRLGSAGDSFNDVISEILKEQKLPQASQKVAHPGEPAIVRAKPHLVVTKGKVDDLAYE
jgi:hypothetical protein